jgi:hypothetical protein
MPAGFGAAADQVKGWLVVHVTKLCNKTCRTALAGQWVTVACACQWRVV